MAPVPQLDPQLPDDPYQRTPISDEDWCLGDPHAPVTLLVYGDLECAQTAAAHPVLVGLVRENPDALRLIYRHYPATDLHPSAQNAAEAAEAAGAQGKFWEMLDLLFEQHPRLDVDHLRRQAHALRLYLAQFDREMNAHIHTTEVRRDLRRGGEDGVTETPAIFINRTRYDGPREREAILAAVATHAAGKEA